MNICYQISICHSKDDIGNVISVRNSKPILDTCVYDDLFSDESLDKYSKNIISNNM